MSDERSSVGVLDAVAVAVCTLGLLAIWASRDFQPRKSSEGYLNLDARGVRGRVFGSEGRRVGISNRESRPKAT